VILGYSLSGGKIYEYEKVLSMPIEKVYEFLELDIRNKDLQDKLNG